VAQPDGPEIIRQPGQTGRERHRAEEQGQYDASAPVIDEVPGEKTAQGVRPHENGHEADIHGVAQLLTRDPALTCRETRATSPSRQVPRPPRQISFIPNRGAVELTLITRGQDAQASVLAA